MMIVAIVLFGLVSQRDLAVDLYPDVDLPFVSISTYLEGASPEIVESEVTDPIEEVISTVEGVRHISSSNSQGVSMVFVEFDLGRDIDVAAQDIRDKVALARRTLPKDVDPPTISKLDLNARPIIWLSLSGNVSKQYLSQVADDFIKPKIETLPGVGSLFTGGFEEREIRVWLDAKKLEAHHLTALDVNNALERENVELPGGRIESDARELTVKTMGQFQTTDAFDNLIIAYREGSPIRLKEVGFAEDGMEDSRSFARFRGVPSTGIGVIPKTGANHVMVAERVKKAMHELRKILPEGLTLEVAFDSSKFIKESIAGVQFDLFFGAILAAIVILLFLRDLRSTIIIGLAIPTSLIGAFSLIYAFGFTMNGMTMLALSLCVGLVIDDAIIVLENIFRHGERGKDPMRAASEGTHEIAFAAIAATLAIVAVFTPVAFLKGLVGKFYFQFGITVSAAVLLSLFVSFTLTPMLASRLLGGSRKHGALYTLLEDSFLALERGYRKALRFSLNHRLLVIVIGLASFVVGLFFFAILDKEVVTSEDQGDFLIRFEAPLGSSLDYADLKMKECEKILLTTPEVSSIFAIVGGGFRLETNKGFMFVHLVDGRERERTQHAVMASLRRKLTEIPGVRVYVEEMSILGGGHQNRSAPLQFDLKGPSLDDLQEISGKVVAELRRVPGIVDVASDMEVTKPEVRVYVDRDKAGDLGVDIRTIASTINTLVGGMEVSKFRQGGKSYDVRVRLIPDQRQKPQDILPLLVRTSRGDVVRLNNLVEVREEIGPNMINRKDRQRSVSIFGNLERKVLGEAIKDTRGIIQRFLPPGYISEVAGSGEAMSETFSSIVFAFFMALLITYMVLASQFESFIHPFTVMLALPLSVSGALGFLWLTGNTLNLMSLIGMVMLMGLVTKNSILLVDYTNTLRARGTECNEAILEAGPVRMRPILMTAISTVAGVMPVALGIGAGGESRAPMAIAAAGGLTTSTLLTLFVVPVVYSLMDDLVNRFKRRGVRQEGGLSPAA
jgi:HAE1 family hydrophobic/amphiphilic exporter-1